MAEIVSPVKPVSPSRAVQMFPIRTPAQVILLLLARYGADEPAEPRCRARPTRMMRPLLEVEHYDQGNGSSHD